MIPIFIFLMTLLSSGFSESGVDEANLKIIEQFLSSMTTLKADMEMDIFVNGRRSNHFEGKIWLDRRKELLRINYGKDKMIAKNGMLFVYQEGQETQKFDATDTPAGILLKSSINFNDKKIAIKNFVKNDERWELFLTYDSPVGQIPVTLFFKPLPVMILLGWEIQNPDGSITKVCLDPSQTHMSISIDSSIFCAE
ncbi:MAG: LolA family protein [Pseudomonadota bacterium]|jgi:hypothetical protein|nr:hypothetical protein [Alphaproteobacteria bacterium]